MHAFYILNCYSSNTFYYFRLRVTRPVSFNDYEDLDHHPWTWSHLVSKNSFNPAQQSPAECIYTLQHCNLVYTVYGAILHILVCTVYCKLTVLLKLQCTFYIVYCARYKEICNQNILSANVYNVLHCTQSTIILVFKGL